MPVSTTSFAFGPMEATREMILAYGRGINDEDPLHTDPAHPGFRAHPLFVSRAIINATGSVLFAPELNIDVSRIVHAGIDIELDEPIHEGDPLSVESDVKKIEDKGGGSRLVHIRYRVRHPRGQAAEGVTRYFERGAGASSPRGSSAASPDARRPADFRVEMPTRKDQSLIYADGPADYFAIHTDDGFARSVGLPGMILHGMCTLALSARAVVSTALGGDTMRLKSIGCRFQSYLLPGQTIYVSGWRQGDAVEFEATDENGRVVIAEGRAGGRAARS